MALVWMMGFHFCFDLSHFGLIQTNFYRDPFWTIQRLVIVSSFIFCAGLGQALAVAQGQNWSRFWSRWWQITTCACLVTLGSWWMFPRSFITFGVLHGMALMLLLTRFLALRHWQEPVLWGIGLVSLLLPATVAHPFFDSRWTNWIGLVTHRPQAEDYVPLFPWFGVMIWGLAAGKWMIRCHPHALMAALPAWSTLHWLAVLGRWSLCFYMLHQPLILGLLVAVRSWAGSA
jgi:uncharacterized membrane protein